MKTAILVASIGCAQAFVPQMNLQRKYHCECPSLQIAFICVCCVLSLCIYASHSRPHLASLPPLPPSSSTTASFMDQLKSGVSKALPVLVGGSAFIAPSISNALTKEDLSSLSYLQVCPSSFPPSFRLPFSIPSARRFSSLCGISSSRALSPFPQFQSPQPSHTPTYSIPPSLSPPLPRFDYR